MSSTPPAGQALGSVITSPAARRQVYALFVVLGFAAGAVTVGFGVLGAIPQWVNVMNAVLAFAGASGIGGLAVANVKPTTVVTDAPTDVPELEQPEQ